MILISFERVISLGDTAQVRQYRELQHNHRLKHFGLIAFQCPHWCRGYFTELVQETTSLQAKFGGKITRIFRVVEIKYMTFLFRRRA